MIEFAELLIDHGADAYAKAADDDKTPLDMAKSKTSISINTETFTSICKFACEIRTFLCLLIFIVRKFLGSKMGYWAWLKTRW